MEKIKMTGGVKVGFLQASWPMGTLVIGPDRLDLHASLFGSYSFAPKDIVHIEPVSGILSSGIRIHHRVDQYNKRIEFFCFKNPEKVVETIRKSGFMNQTETQQQAAIEKKQQFCGFPFRISAVLVVLTGWLLLLFSNFRRYTTGADTLVIFLKGAILATAYLFMVGFITSFLPPVRKLVLRQGREIAEVKNFLYFLMFMTGLMFILLNIIVQILGVI